MLTNATGPNAGASKQSTQKDKRFKTVIQQGQQKTPGNDETPNVEHTWDPSEFNTVLITKCKDYLTVIGTRIDMSRLGVRIPPEDGNTK